MLIFVRKYMNSNSTSYSLSVFLILIGLEGGREEWGKFITYKYDIISFILIFRSCWQL